MAAANPNAIIHTLEHDPVWASVIKYNLERHGLNNVKVHFSPLENYGEFDWYDVPDDLPEFDFVVCDGPPRKTRGGRHGLFPVMNKKIKSGARLIFDDYEDIVKSDIEQWGGEVTTYGKYRLMAVTTRK
jgi:precorrin-6B methylase 2